MREKIIEILEGIRPEYNFSESVNFIQEGMLDSTDVVTLVAEIEEEFDVTIPGTEISMKNFSSLDGIIDLVKKYKGAN